MNPGRFTALKLRLTGLSYNEIRKQVPVSKSTLSLWLKDVIISDKARQRLDERMRTEGARQLIVLNKLQTKRAEERARKYHTEGKRYVLSSVASELAQAGAILYWAEGYKRLKVRDGKERMGHTISFVNSDAEMVSVFVKFLQRALVIPAEKIRLGMRLYAHINENSALAHWSTTTGLPKENFFKTTYLISGASKGIRPYNRLPWGTLQVQVCDTAKFHYLMGMIEGVKQKSLCDKMPILPG